MEKYDYRRVVYDKTLEWLRNNVCLDGLSVSKEKPSATVVGVYRNVLMERAREITGESAWFSVANDAAAVKCLSDNQDLLEEALAAETKCGFPSIRKGPAYFDALIRRYLLIGIADQVIEEFIRTARQPFAPTGNKPCQPSASELYGLRAAFGTGVTVVDVFTGRMTDL